MPADQADLSASLGPLELADSLNPMPDLSSSGTLGLSDSGGMSLSGTGFGSLSGATESGKGMGSGSGSGSGISLAGSGEGDALSLDDEAVSSDATSVTKGKDDTVVSSVGISVFDEEELEQSADPKAKTMMTGSAAGGTGLEGVGSGSGLLDLTRESDDTSLGAELLDEIYPSDEGATVEMGEATRAGLDSALVEPTRPTKKAKKAGADAFESVAEAEDEPVVAGRGAGRATAAVSAGDPFWYGTSGLIAVAIVVMCFAGLALASMIRGVWPSLLSFVYAKLWMFGVGALLVAGAGMGLGVFLGKRSARA
ncbi:MAG: hypothetical protein HOP29_13265 [Phycisphaerales bacterium]|nr:hypothetical protein [Phycisphaerales bacterium]